ncbi:VanZ like family protein [compost metagenome]
MCIPLGVYLLIIFNVDTIASVTKISFLFSLCIEVTQFILQITVSNGRSMDINDLISNTLGGILGYLVVKSLIKNQTFANLINRFNL